MTSNLDLLTESPGNPVPSHARAGLLPVGRQGPLRYALFSATSRPTRGTVLLLHGRNESIEKYFETVGDLNRRGFMVASFDWRGQGGSGPVSRSPLPGFAFSFDDYLADIEAFFDEVLLPDCPGPYFVLAHSTGALAALLAAPFLANRVRRMVLVAPLLKFARRRFPPGIVRFLTGLMTFSGLGGVAVTGRRGSGESGWYPGNLLTSDRRRFERNFAIFETEPALAAGRPTARWTFAALGAMARVKRPDFSAAIRLPMVIVAAGADRVVSTPAIERYARHLRSGRCITIEGAQHEILQERDLYREQFWSVFDAFIPGTGVTDVPPPSTPEAVENASV